MRTPTDLSSLIPTWRSRVERRLVHLLAGMSQGDGVSAAMRDAVLSPGKRLRPLLVLATGHAIRPDAPGVLDAACAIEMVHSASLALDDMPCMDNAQTRRGQPTLHLHHGEDVTSLAVIALVTQACATLAGLTGVEGALRARLVQVLCEAVGPRGLVGGQYRDLRQGAGSRTRDAIAAANEQKTGLLFACAFEIGALVAGAPRAVPVLRRAAIELGHAFQLRDDLDDVSLTAAEARKDVGKDTGKSTMVALLGRSAVEEQLREHLHRADALLQEVLTDGTVLTALLRQAFHVSLSETGAPVDVAPQATKPVANAVLLGEGSALAERA